MRSCLRARSAAPLTQTSPRAWQRARRIFVWQRAFLHVESPLQGGTRCDGRTVRMRTRASTRTLRVRTARPRTRYTDRCLQNTQRTNTQAKAVCRTACKLYKHLACNVHRTTTHARSRRAGRSSSPGPAPTPPTAPPSRPRPAGRSETSDPCRRRGAPAPPTRPRRSGSASGPLDRAASNTPFLWGVAPRAPAVPIHLPGDPAAGTPLKAAALCFARRAALARGARCAATVGASGGRDARDGTRAICRWRASAAKLQPEGCREPGGPRAVGRRR